MSDEKFPQRPEGAGPAPRVEVEPTPQPAEQTQQTEAQRGAASAAGTAPTEQIPYVASTSAPVTETVKHTVVKTKTKKLPVFLASLAGLAVGAVLVIALVMSGAFRITDTNVVATDSGSSKGTTQTLKIDAEDTTLAEAVSAKALPSVVSITAMTGNGGSASSQNSSSNSAGSIGSGVVLDTDGNILTNYHVVEGATSMTVSTSDGGSYEAELVGSDESSDLAVIRLKGAKASDLTPIEIGDSDKLTVGEWVMAIGSPFGNEASVSTGIVSALYRSTALPSTTGTSIYANMIQTDAAINPGNSGGALVNDEGKLIGINSVIESYSGSSSGVGFAIPVKYAKNIADQIISGKTPVHAYLGVTLTSVNATNAQQNNLAVTSGAYVSEVTADSPADKAGMKKGDIIVAVDGEEISSADGLIIAVRGHDVGDKVDITVNRDGKEEKLSVTLGSDEALQNTGKDDTTQGDGSGNGMTEEEFLRYLQELLGRGGNGGQQGNGL